MLPSILSSISWCKFTQIRNVQGWEFPCRRIVIQPISFWAASNTFHAFCGVLVVASCDAMGISMQINQSHFFLQFHLVSERDGVRLTSYGKLFLPSFYIHFPIHRWLEIGSMEGWLIVLNSSSCPLFILNTQSNKSAQKKSNRSSIYNSVQEEANTYPHEINTKTYTETIFLPQPLAKANPKTCLYAWSDRIIRRQLLICTFSAISRFYNGSRRTKSRLLHIIKHREQVKITTTTKILTFLKTSIYYNFNIHSFFTHSNTPGTSRFVLL